MSSRRHSGVDDEDLRAADARYELRSGDDLAQALSLYLKHPRSRYPDAARRAEGYWALRLKLEEAWARWDARDAGRGTPSSAVSSSQQDQNGIEGRDET